jgi:hypothetical protein
MDGMGKKQKNGLKRKVNVLMTKREIDNGNNHKTVFIVHFKLYSASVTEFKDIARSLIITPWL